VVIRETSPSKEKSSTSSNGSAPICLAVTWTSHYVVAQSVPSRFGIIWNGGTPHHGQGGCVCSGHYSGIAGSRETSTQIVCPTTDVIMRVPTLPCSPYALISAGAEDPKTKHVGCSVKTTLITVLRVIKLSQSVGEQLKTYSRRHLSTANYYSADHCLSYPLTY